MKNKFIYRNVEGEEYILAHSNDNIIEYRINKKELLESNVSMMTLDQCKIPVYYGQPIKSDDGIYMFNCDDYIIEDLEQYIRIQSIYEQPILSVPLTIHAGNEVHEIQIHNVLCYDKDYTIKKYLWNKEGKGIYSERDRIVFKTPVKNKFNLLKLEKRISANFTVHMSFGYRKSSEYVEPCIVINESVIVYFGLKNKKSMTITYIGNDNAEQEVTVQLPEDMLRGKLNASISKTDGNLKIQLQDVDNTTGTPPFLFEKKEVFKKSQWSTFAVGNYRKAAPLELFSVMVVGKLYGKH